MHKKAAVLLIFWLSTLSLAAWPQVVPDTSLPTNFSTIHPTDRITSAIDDDQRIVLSGQHHPLATAKYETGALPPNQRMSHMVLVLKGSAEQEAALEELLQAQQQPGSANYHQWLTPTAFGQRFGASVNDMEKIATWLQAHGMQIEEIPSSQRAIVFSGTVAQVESTFHTSMRTYFAEGKSHYANASDPEIPEAFANVVHGVVSLHDFLSTPMSVITTPAFTSGGSHYLMPADWATIYDVNALYNQGITGTGETIAVLGRVDISLTDVSTFRSNAGLPANQPQVVVNGSDPGDPDQGDQMESSLDVEWAGAIAKNATVKFVTSASGSSDGIALSAQYAVTHNVAPIITLSYGSCEMWEGSSGNAFWNSLWQQAAAQGQSVFVSAGDSGAAGCDSSSSSTASYGRGVNGLCSSPYSTCVGGTGFNEGNSTQYWSSSNGSGLVSAQSYIPEAVWNESGGGNGLWSGGGGVSTVYSKPSWQSAAGVPSDGMRDVPDVSASAAIHDAYIVQMSGSMTTVGGTSAAAPSLASAMALVVQNAGAAQGNLDPNLYVLGTRQYSGGGAAVFHDVTTGNNSVPGLTGFNAGTGYDQASGLGSVDVTLMANHWSDASANFTLTPASSSLTVARGYSNTVSVSLTVSGGFSSAVTLAASGAPTGVTVKFSSATLTSSAPVTVTISAASTAAAGSSTITLTGTGAGLKHTAQIALTLVTPTFTLTPSATSTTVTAGTPATVTFTTAGANSFQAAVAFSISGLPTGVTGTFSPTSVASPGNGSTTLTLSATPSTAKNGSATLTVTASGGGVTQTQKVSLTVVVPSFTLAANATTASVIAGKSTTFTLTTAVSNGFNSAVALSISGLPTGVTAAFSPTSISSPNNGSSTLTLTVASSATAGMSSLKVTATGGGITQTQTISLTVLVPSFTLTSNSSTGSLIVGSTAAFTLTSAGENFSSAIALSISGLPSGVTAAFSPTSIASPGNGSSTLTLTGASNATSGSSHPIVTATGGGVVKTLTLNLTVPAPSFNLAVGSTTASVAIGKTTQVSVATSVLNGFSSTVALSISGLPNGVTGAFSPTTLTAGSSSGSVLTLTAASTAAVGTSKPSVSAVGGGVTKTQALTLQVTH